MFMSRFRYLAAILLGVTTSTWVSAGEPKSVKSEIQQVLTKQAKAWNEGDIDAFMKGYWKSDKLTFSAAGKTTRGWRQTLENYKKRYPTREKMGQLTFSNLECTPLGNKAAVVLGRWHLKRTNDPVGGNFTLVFRNVEDRWVIIHDHTSVLTAK